MHLNTALFIRFIMRFHDESEIDEWFNEQKEKLDTELFDKCMKDHNAIDKGRAVYHKKMKSLLKKYETISLKFIDNQERKKRFMKPIKNIQHKWKVFKIIVSTRKKGYIENWKKKRFDKKYNKMMEEVKNRPL